MLETLAKPKWLIILGAFAIIFTLINIKLYYNEFSSNTQVVREEE